MDCHGRWWIASRKCGAKQSLDFDITFSRKKILHNKNPLFQCQLNHCEMLLHSKNALFIAIDLMTTERAS